MRRLYRPLLLTIAFLLGTINSQAQLINYSFRHLTSSEGLSDGVVHAIMQDKKGFIWIGTSYGLNRFDGISLKTYFWNQKDSNSLYDNYVRSLFVDEKGRLWVGTITGLCRFDDQTEKFTRFHTARPQTISEIKQDQKGQVWVGTTYGIYQVNEEKKTLEKFQVKGFEKQYSFSVRQINDQQKAVWYIATDNGIKVFDPTRGITGEIHHDAAQKNSLTSDWVHSLAFDRSGNLWAACLFQGSIMDRINMQDHTVKEYRHFADPAKKWSTNTIQQILADEEGRLWAISSYSGLSFYNKEKDDFEDILSQPELPNSLLSNTNVVIYQDRQGTIWLGTPGYGVSYFNPSRQFFSSIYPQVGVDQLETWSRAVSEDMHHNVWLATGKGIAVLDSTMHISRVFSNIDGKQPELHYNSVRALLTDDHGDTWIGTAQGLNRYHPSTGKMDFYTGKEGMPKAFFWMIVQDKQGTVWLGSATGLYRYDRTKDRFDDLTSDSLLSKYAHQNIQSLYAGRDGHLWIGMLDVGLVNYDPLNHKATLLTIEGGQLSDTRFSSFDEDLEGNLWIGAENGLTVYDQKKNTSHTYTREDGLPSDRTNNIMVDSLDRVWFGTSNGLCMLNAKRDRFSKFDINDGLLTNQFNEQGAFRLHDGRFVFPTYKGFLVFRPEAYRETGMDVPVYLTSFSVAGRKPEIGPEELQSIELKHDQNFFSISLAGLNYMNPYNCTYAYKLEPFDKDWIYTDKRDINYTNVPAGKYTFRYKVLTGDRNEVVPEKQAIIHIRQVIYKTWWFRSIIALLLVAAIFGFYIYRVRHREKIMVLQGKAQLLEKEKTMVMYESLKQQLNPHFLFNSLTSLRGLIKTDPATATHFLDGMSKVYRYVLKSGEHELINLGEELGFVRTFTELQQTRFDKGLIVDINIDPVWYSKYIAPVTLQNLVENAIKHNTADKESPLRIELFVEDGWVVVRNNLQRYRLVETSNKKGLSGLKSLYRFLSDKQIVIQEDEKTFTVKIPLI